jgi:hypothetical protein
MTIGRVLALDHRRVGVLDFPWSNASTVPWGTTGSVVPVARDHRWGKAVSHERGAHGR